MSRESSAAARTLRPPAFVRNHFVLTAAAFASSCIVGDGDHRCDTNQVYVDDGRTVTCVCAPNTIQDSRGHGCAPCGENEEVRSNECVCKAGYVKPTATSACELSVGQMVGAGCAGPGTCTDPYPYCVTDGSAQYCTKQGCTPSGCPTGYSCEPASGSSFCAKLPTGLGVACTTGGDECAAFEANYCESFMAKTCFIQGCATGQVKCPGEYGCCDLSGVAGMPLSLCFAPAQLPGGKCAAGTLVTP